MIPSIQLVIQYLIKETTLLYQPAALMSRLLENGMKGVLKRHLLQNSELILFLISIWQMKDEDNTNVTSSLMYTTQLPNV